MLNIMKTYKATIDKPRLVIRPDNDAESPRAWDNLGLFLFKHPRYQSPDGNVHELYRIMVETGDEAENQADHIKRMKQEAKKQGINLIAVFPVVLYDHSGVIYRRGDAHGFDYSNGGFYFITPESMKYRIGKGKKPSMAEMKRIVDAELDDYTKWANGDVWEFELYDENGETSDSINGFYDIEDIREHLPKEWKKEDLREYIVYN